MAGDPGAAVCPDDGGELLVWPDCLGKIDIEAGVLVAGAVGLVGEGRSSARRVGFQGPLHVGRVLLEGVADQPGPRPRADAEGDEHDQDENCDHGAQPPESPAAPVRMGTGVPAGTILGFYPMRDPELHLTPIDRRGTGHPAVPGARRPGRVRVRVRVPLLANAPALA